jgi:PPK2 family polyphosphate:nucleotide phosphotransferase
MKRSKIARALQAKPGHSFRCSDRSTVHSQLLKSFASEGDEPKHKARQYIEENLRILAQTQELLYSNASHSVLIIFQGLDASGKDGMIKHVMSGVNPQGCIVANFKRPSDEERTHPFLWRYQKHLPPSGKLGIFNRSYYEAVLVERVHPEQAGSRTPGELPPRFWQERLEDINNFEKHLTRNGTVILKFFLHISKKEQRKRLLARLTDPAKQWKFSSADLAERACWDKYIKAFEKAISASSTRWAPWYIVPADDKWSARAAVSAIIIHSIKALDLKPMQVSRSKSKELADAEAKLIRGKI